MKQKTQLTTFTHGDLFLSECVLQDGVPYATRRAIGECLGFADPHGAVDQILKLNPHIELFSVPVRVSVAGRRARKISVYSPLAAILIGYETSRPEARQMRIAMSNIWAECDRRRWSQSIGATGTAGGSQWTH